MTLWYKLNKPMTVYIRSRNKTCPICMIASILCTEHSGPFEGEPIMIVHFYTMSMLYTAVLIYI